MAYRVILPKLGTNIDKAVISYWLKREGDSVVRGEALMGVETAKAVFEVEAEHSGILRKILYSKGAEVSITQTVGIIAEVEEDISGMERLIKEEGSRIERVYAQEKWKEWFKGEEGDSVEVSMRTVRMSPAARKLAKEKSVKSGDLERHFQGKKEVLEIQDVQDFLDRKKVVIYGAGLGARQTLEIISSLKNIEVAGFIDDNSELEGKTVHGYKVLGNFDKLKIFFEAGRFKGVVLSFHSEARRKIFMRLKKVLPQIQIESIIDSRAVISKNIEMGEGVFIEAGAVIGPGVKLGKGVIVDLGAVICHDCTIGDYCHLSPGCTLSGIVCLKENVLVGVGSSINSTVTVGRNVIIAPGSAVENNIGEDLVVSGVPCKTIGRSGRGK